MQDPYCLRCQPQVTGACLDVLRACAATLVREANAVTDNPLVLSDGAIVSGGNFHAEPVALAADQIALAVAETGSIAQRRIAMLVDPALNFGLPPFLTPEPGLNSGFMIAEVTSAALMSENKQLAAPASVDSTPTSANQEDHVSMAAHAAHRLLRMCGNLRQIVGIEALVAAQGRRDARTRSVTSEPLRHGSWPASGRTSPPSAPTATSPPTSLPPARWCAIASLSRQQGANSSHHWPRKERAHDRPPFRQCPRRARTVTTVGEDAMTAALEGRLSAAHGTYPARRLVQTFLDQQIVVRTRNSISDLPDLVDSAQEVLVDAVRLVAFELEQAAGQADAEASFEDDAADSGALSSVIEARVSRLDVAAEELRQFLEQLRTKLREEVVPSLNGARAAAVGSSTRSDTTASRAVASVGIGRQFKEAVEATERGMGNAMQWVIRGPTGAVVRSESGDLIDDLSELRASLLPNADLQVELPLLYRRIFGRAALEKADLLRGRDDEIARLGRAVSRWIGGASGPIAVIGEPRSGRTSLAGLVARELLQDRTIIRVQPNPGGSDDVESVNAAVVAAVGGRDGQGAEGALRAMPPGAVVLLDELGRWMSRTPGGLEGLRLWQRLWRRLGDRHLFVVVGTPYTWKYASQLLAFDQGFLGLAKCGPVRPEAIKDLLLLRQRTADFELEFERTGWGPLRWPDAINEGRQMTRLYERCRGNIGDALDLWRRSVVAATERRITLYVAPEPDLSTLRRIPLRWRAALTAVAFHRSVSPARLAVVMRTGREEATALLADLERAQLVASERSGAWSLDPVLQPYVIRSLRQRGGLG